MNLKQLQYVVVIAECKSFSQAARQCHVTQPTLSNAISQLEEELGDRLFVRTTRKVGLTAFGEYLLSSVKAVLDAQKELETAAHQFHNPEQSVLRIGFSPLVDMPLLHTVLNPFQQANPAVTVFFKECLLDDLSARLNQEQIDFAVVPSDPQTQSVNTARFYEESLYYIPCQNATYDATHAHYSLASLPDVPIILTGGGCGLNGALKELFRQKEHTLTAYPGQAISYPVIEEWASLGIGAGILPKSRIRSENTSIKPLTDASGEHMSLSFDWQWERHVARRKDLKIFRQYLEQSVPALVKGMLRDAGT